MKRFLLLTFAFAAVPLALRCQIAVDPVNYEFKGQSSQTDIAYHIHIANTTPDTIALHWTKRLNSGPTQWLPYICDPNACYDPDTYSNPVSRPIIIGPGDTIDYQMHIKPQNTVGTGEFVANILDDQGNVLESITAQVEIGLTSTISATGQTSPTLYPNPASDYFQVNGLTGIRFIEIYNIVGSKVRTFEAVPQKQYFVGDLTHGMYLVRLITPAGKVVKTLRLSIR